MLDLTEFSKTPEVVGPRFRTEADGRLALRYGGREYPSVSVRRCFPWSEPERFFSIRDAEGTEVLVVEALADLDSESARALARALNESSFVFEIETIEDIREEFELRLWRVRTKQGGERRFQTKLNAWPRETPGRSLVVQDVGGDLYVIRDPKSLDPASAKRLWAFMDDD